MKARLTLIGRLDERICYGLKIEGDPTEDAVEIARRHMQVKCDEEGRAHSTAEVLDKVNGVDALTFREGVIGHKREGFTEECLSQFQAFVVIHKHVSAAAQAAE